MVGGEVLGLGTIFFTNLIVGFSGAMMPGPLLTVTINESARRGFKAGPLIVLGHAILELALVIGLFLGLSRVIQNPVFGAAIGLVGGALLLWMGFDMAKNAWRGTLSLDLDVTDKKVMMGPVLLGIVISISNPYWSLWWAGIGMTYITKAWVLGLAGIGAFYTGHIMADLIWYSAVAAAVTGGRRLMSDRIYRGIIGVCGVFLMWLGFNFIRAGIEKFF